MTPLEKFILYFTSFNLIVFLLYVLFVKKDNIKKWWKAYLYKRSIYPFIEDDFKYPCRVFGYESYFSEYGCEIIKPKGVTIIWCHNPKIHPNVTFEKKLFCG